MNNVREYERKRLVAAGRADIRRDEPPKTPAENTLDESQTKELVTWLKETLGERASEVRASERLVDSPAVALNADKFMTPQMRRMMKAMKQDSAEADTPPRVTFEINPRHALIRKLYSLHTEKPDSAKLVAEQIFDNALIAAGLLDDARAMVSRIYKLLETVG